MKTKTLALFISLIMLLSLSLTGCGSSSSSTTDGSASGTAISSSGSSSGASGSTSEKLAAELAKYTEKKPYSITADPIKASSIMSGKKIYIIPANLSVPFDEQTCKAMINICKSMGIQADMYATDGSTDSWISGIESGVNQGYNAIVCFSGVNMNLVSSQIEYAKSKGVQVIDAHFHDFADKDSCKASYCLAASYELFGRIEAMWAIQSAGDKGDIVIVTSRDLDASKAMEKGIESAFKDYAPKAKHTYVNVVLTDWATKIQSETQNALLADPNVNYVIGLYDAMTTYISAAIDSVGVADKVKICSYNGTPFALDLINQGKVDMDLGECLDNMAYCLLDQTFRIIGGLKPLEDENAPLYIWSSKNIKDALGSNGKAGYGGYDQSYADFYKKLWGLN